MRILRRGTMFSTGMQATATGMGGDVLIFDDPLNPEQAISQVEREAVNLRFDTTFRSRINDPVTGVKIIVMQRLHELDLTGHVLERESRAGNMSVCLPSRKKIKNGNSRLTHELKFRKQAICSGLSVSRNRFWIASASVWAVGPSTDNISKARRRWTAESSSATGCAFTGRFQKILSSWCSPGTALSPAAVTMTLLPARSGRAPAENITCSRIALMSGLTLAPPWLPLNRAMPSFPSAHAVLIEDKANGPAIISELQKEIPGVVAVNPEGGKLARAQATAPLWESGSIELPDPQVFGATWMEDYLHNICAFPKAAHDDDMDATSQALIYMRSRLGGGIVDFYRQQSMAIATGQVQPTESRRYSGAQRTALRLKSGDPVAIEDSVLTRDLIEAVAQGSQLQCNAKQYPEIRAALSQAAGLSSDSQDASRSLLISREVERLDLLFAITTEK